MKTIAEALLVVLFLDILLFMCQTAAMEINPEGPVYYVFDGSYISQFDEGDFTLSEDFSNDLPSSANTVAVETGGNFFTDTFATMRDWAIDSIPGLRLAINVINAIPNFIKSFGGPPELSFAIGVLWHAFAFLLVLIFIKD